MPVEPAATIDQLDPTLPNVDDPITEGDDHIRLIKQVLKNTFSGIDVIDPVTTEARIASIESRLDNIEAALLLKADITAGGEITGVTYLEAASIKSLGTIEADGNISGADITCTNLTASAKVTAVDVEADTVSSGGNVIAYDGS